MRSLYLMAFLTLLAPQVSLSFASPTAWCTNGLLSNITFAPSASGAYTLSACTITGLVNISGDNIPSITPSSAIDILVTDSVISGPASALQIFGPGAAGALTKCPFRVTVKGNTFTNGIFRIQGSLPPNSFVSFEGNAMTMSVINALTGNSVSFCQISIASAALIVLNENSTISVSNNNLLVDVVSTTYLYHLVFTSLALGANSSFEVSENIFQCLSLSTQITGIHGDNFISGLGSARVNFTGSFSTFLIDNNTFSVPQKTLTSMALNWAQGFRQDTGLNLEGTLVSISGNTAYVNQSSSLIPFYIGAGSQFHNLYFANNVVTRNVNFAVFYLGTPTVMDGGSILITNNTFNFIMANNLTNHVVLLVTPKIGTNASVFITCNSVFASGMSGNGYLLRINNPPSSATSYLFYYHNTYSWLSTLPTVSQLIAAASSMPNLIMEVDTCLIRLTKVAEETTTEATTTSETTTEATTTSETTTEATTTSETTTEATTTSETTSEATTTIMQSTNPRCVVGPLLCEAFFSSAPLVNRNGIFLVFVILSFFFLA